MSRVVTISYTTLDAPGGVPRWNRDFHSAFPDWEKAHFCWQDFPGASEGASMPEWVKAQVLNQYLLQKRLVTSDDVIIADGFWLSGLEHLPRVVSVCHGIWGHVTKDDVDAGKMPENQFLHVAQVDYRRKLWALGVKMVAVSDFIADEMERQWGWKVPVINTGIDLSIWSPLIRGISNKLIIVHGINDRGNRNKGWDHIEAVKRVCIDVADVLSFDELHERTGCLIKSNSLPYADLCVIPSSFEGNSLFCLETLACDIPIIGYDVGLPYLAKKLNQSHLIGRVLDRNNRTPQYTASCVYLYLIARLAEGGEKFERPRDWVSQFSIDKFRQQWYDYVKGL